MVGLFRMFNLGLTNLMVTEFIMERNGFMNLPETVTFSLHLTVT